MKTWQNRKQLIQIGKLTPEQYYHELDSFENLKNYLISTYQLEELTEEEIEEYLVKKLIESEQVYESCYALDDMILKGYAEEYLNTIDYGVKKICSLSPDTKSLPLKYQEQKNRINQANRKALFKAFNTYFCHLEGSSFVNHLTEKTIPILKGNKLIKMGIKKDLFSKETSESGVQPNLTGPHYNPGFCYDVRRYQKYTDYCREELKKVQLLETLETQVEGKPLLEYNLETYSAYAKGLKLKQDFKEYGQSIEVKKI